MNKPTRLTLPLAALTLAAAALQPAFAARPLQTDDAGVLERGACELEGASQRLSADGSSADEYGLQLGCGIGLNTSVALGMARASEDTVTTRGLSLSGKTALWQGEGARAPGLSVSYGFTQAKENGQEWKHAATEANAIFSLPLSEDATLHFNIGHERDEVARMAGTSWGIAYEHVGSGNLAPMVELFGDDREAPWWNVGLRWQGVPDRFSLDVSYGRQIVTGRPSLVTVGFKLAF